MSTFIPAPRSLVDRTCTALRIPLSRRTVRHDHPRLAPRVVDLRTALDRAIARVSALDGRVTVVCDDVAASVDPEVVEEVVTHLLHLEAAIPDHRVVWVSAVPAGDGVVLTVEDDAEWIADDPALRRGRSSTSAPLQLARVAQLARAQGGACWVEPAVEQGVRFVVDLPGRFP